MRAHYSVLCKNILPYPEAAAIGLTAIMTELYRAYTAWQHSELHAVPGHAVGRRTARIACSVTSCCRLQDENTSFACTYLFISVSVIVSMTDRPYYLTMSVEFGSLSAFTVHTIY